MSAIVRPPPVLARFHRAFLARSCLDALFGRSVWQIGNINLTSHRIRTKNSQKETVNGYIYKLHRGGQPTCEEYRAHSDTRMGVTHSLYSHKALDTAAGRGAECIGRSALSKWSTLAPMAIATPFPGELQKHFAVTFNNHVGGNRNR